MTNTLRRGAGLVSLLLATTWTASTASTASTALAQPPHPRRPQGEELAVPPGWQVRTAAGTVPAISDQAGAQAGAPAGDHVFFVTMTPGWHLTTGPAILVWHPELAAQGLFRLEVEIFLFDPPGSNQGFGLFVGGEALDGEEPRYDTFLVRGAGESTLEGRAGAPYEVVEEWTTHPAIARVAETGEGPARNRLAIDADVDWVSYEINGQPVARLPREEANAEGIVGLWVGAGLNIHVADLQVFAKHAAP